MSVSLLIWTLSAMIFAGLHVFTQRIIAHEKRDSAFNGFMMYAVSGALALAFFFTQPPLSAQWQLAGIFGLLAGATHACGNFIRIEALRHIDSVIYFPLNKVLGPVLVIIGGVFIFAEDLSWAQYVGIFFSLSVPLLLVTAAEHTRQKNLKRGLWFVVFSTLFTSASILLTKQGLLQSSDLAFFLVMSQLAGSVASTAIFVRNERSLKHLTRRDVWLGFLGGVFGFISYLTLLKAVEIGYISIVYTIQAHYILIPILLSIWWYKEHINMRKLTAVLVSFLAIGLLAE